MTGVFVVAAVVVRDERGRLLTVRKRGTSAFMLPGGKIEPGESPREAGLRELREEVGVDLDELAPLARYDAPAANEPGWRVDAWVFTGALHGRAADLAAAAEIAELRWADPWTLDAWPAAEVAPLLRDVLPDLTTYVVVGRDLGAGGHTGLTEQAERAERVLRDAAYVVGPAGLLADLPPAGTARETRVGDPATPAGLALLDERLGRPVVVVTTPERVADLVAVLTERYGRRRVRDLRDGVGDDVGDGVGEDGLGFGSGTSSISERST